MATTAPSVSSLVSMIADKALDSVALIILCSWNTFLFLFVFWLKQFHLHHAASKHLRGFPHHSHCLVWCCFCHLCPLPQAWVTQQKLVLHEVQNPLSWWIGQPLEWLGWWRKFHKEQLQWRGASVMLKVWMKFMHCRRIQEFMSLRHNVWTLTNLFSTVPFSTQQNRTHPESPMGERFLCRNFSSDLTSCLRAEWAFLSVETDWVHQNALCSFETAVLTFRKPHLAS